MRIDVGGRDESDRVEFSFELDWPPHVRLPVAGEDINFDLSGPEARFRVDSVEHWFDEEGFSVLVHTTLMSGGVLAEFRARIGDTRFIHNFQLNYI